MTTKVKSENYTIIQGWMLSELNLKGNKLIIYAIIHGFSQGLENQKFTGSLQYLADWTNSTKRGVMLCLSEMVEKGLLLKNEKVINKVKYCSYWSTKFTRGSEESSLGGGEESSPNNIDIYKLDNIKEPKGSKKENTDFEEFWTYYPKQRAGNKKKALTSYLLALKENRTTSSDLLVSVKKYASSEEVERGYAKGCSAWLSDDRFNNEYMGGSDSKSLDDELKGIL